MTQRRFLVRWLGALGVTLALMGLVSQGTTNAAQRTTSQQPVCVNINTADLTELQRIIHIGPDRAQQILVLREERPFRAVNELTRVKGIGAARLRDIIAQGVACVQEAPQ